MQGQGDQITAHFWIAVGKPENLGEQTHANSTQVEQGQGIELESLET